MSTRTLEMTLATPGVDAEGRLVGVNSMVVDGLGAAVPATVVHRFVERALERRAA